MVTRESPITSILPEAFGAKKSEIQSRRPSRWRGNVKRRSSLGCGTSSVTTWRARLRFVNDHVVPIALRREISPDHFWLEQSAGDYFFFKLLLYWAELLLDQFRIVFLRCGLQLPLVLEQRCLVDVRKELAQVVVFLYPHSPERRRGNIGRVADHRTALGEYRTGFVVNRKRLRVFFDRPAFFQSRLLCSILGRQIFHDVHPHECVVAVEKH